MFSTAFLLAVSMVVGQAESQVPPKILEEITFLAGQWESEGTFKDHAFKGTIWRSWAPKRTCLVMDLRSDIFTATGIVGFDGASGEIVETGYNAQGVRVENRYKVVSDSIWEGTVVVITPSGDSEEGTIRLEKTSHDSYTFEAKTPKTTLTERARRIRRLEQAGPTAHEQLKELEPLVGNWEARRDDGTTIKWWFAWNQDGTLLENEVIQTDPEGKQTIYNKGMFGWDQREFRISNRCFNQAGNQLTFFWVKTGDKTWQTWLRGTSGRIDVVFIDENSWKMGSGDSESVFKRTSPD